MFDKHRSQRPAWALVFAVAALASFPCAAHESLQAPPPQDAKAPSMYVEHAEPGVVILALGSVSPEAQLLQSLRGLMRSIHPLLFSDNPILDIQMGIAKTTAPFGPVLLLAADTETLAYIKGSCSRFGICQFLDEGKIRIGIVPHEGPWVRDYGPQFGMASDGTPVVFDAKYDDRHIDAQRKHERSKVNLERYEIIKKQLSTRRQGSADPGLREIRPLEEEEEAPALDELGWNEVASEEIDAEEESVAITPEEIELLMQLEEWLQEAGAEEEEKEEVPSGDRLALLRDLAEIYNDSSTFQRDQDDSAPYALAEVALKDIRFSVRRPSLSLDGGNMFRFPGDECVTTREIIGKNDGMEENVRSTLTEVYGCQEIVYLHPLAGADIIKHVDMFLLPVKDKEVLLAWYDPDTEPLRSHWSSLTAEQKALVFEAAVAMQQNKTQLEKRGYVVHLVPSLAPETSFIDGSYFFPTVLNALVRTNSQGNRQVLVPSYEGIQEDIQARALEIIKLYFGSRTQVETIESTFAAMGQGAIHCLTLTVPEKLSVFADTQEHEIRSALNRRVKALEEEFLAANNYSLEGRWTQSDSEESLSVVIDADSIRYLMADSSEALTLPYKVLGRNSKEWYFKSSLSDKSIEGKILWNDRDSFSLLLGSEPAVSLVRESTPAAQESPAVEGGISELP